MKIRELLTEAAYHDLVNALKRARPDQAAAIDAELVWAKNSLKRPDRINWYMLVVKNYFNNTLPQVQGNYDFTSLEQLHHDLIHYYGYNAPSIEAYVYEKQTIGELISALDRLLKKHEEDERNKPKPVTPQTGDHVLFNFGGGVQWWWVDRAYCSDEGRSGRHCGNGVGQHKTDQRLLSLRKNGHVLLTFVLEPDGTLGEMKARGNQKPAEKYHPKIIRLLMWDQVKGITGMGYLPDANFSMFDLSEANLAYMDTHKPKLIADQCQVTPIEILRAPESIQKKYQQHIKNSAIQQLISDSSTDSWSRATARDPKLIIYAPHDMPNFENRLLAYFKSAKPEYLLKAPSSISRNPELLNKIVAVKGSLIAGVNPSVREYQTICQTAVNQNVLALRYIPKEFRDLDMCRIAVNQNGLALEYVPEESRDLDMCRIAVNQNGLALEYVPEESRDQDMYRTAVKSRGSALRLVPEESRDRDLYMTAVNQSGYVLGSVPYELRDRDMCRIAVKSDGGALAYVPEESRDRDLYMTAVNQDGYAIAMVPDESRDRDMCRIAVKSYGGALRYVPDESRDLEMCRIAVKSDGGALEYVPKESRDLEMCRIAVKSDGGALQYVPNKLRDLDMCRIAVKSYGSALQYVPMELRDLDICRTAVKQNGDALRFVPDELRDRLQKEIIGLNNQ